MKTTRLAQMKIMEPQITQISTENTNSASSVSSVANKNPWLNEEEV